MCCFVVTRKGIPEENLLVGAPILDVHIPAAGLLVPAQRNGKGVVTDEDTTKNIEMLTNYFGGGAIYLETFPNHKTYEVKRWTHKKEKQKNWQNICP